MVLSCIECQMKYIPQVFNFEAGMTIMFDHFDSLEFAFINTIHQFPRALPFVGDFLNLEVEK